VGDRLYVGGRGRDRRGSLPRAVGSPGERKERLRRELRQQAVRISAWFVEMHKDSHGEDSRGEDSRGEAWLPPELQGRVADVELLNNSADPVTDVLIFLSRVSYKVQRW
jgi:hypothetical protein